MTRQEVPPLLTLSGAVLEAQWDRVGHITLSDRCRRPVCLEKKKKPPCLIFGTRTIVWYSHCALVKQDGALCSPRVNLHLIGQSVPKRQPPEALMTLDRGFSS